jgi:hypothetical protein
MYPPIPNCIQTIMVTGMEMGVHRPRLASFVQKANFCFPHGNDLKSLPLLMSLWFGPLAAPVSD